MHSNLDNTEAWNQIVSLGIIVQMEGLLSCNGEEMGMLEDMIVGLEDMMIVTVKIVQETAQRQSIELITKKWDYCIDFIKLVSVNLPSKETFIADFENAFKRKYKYTVTYLNNMKTNSWYWQTFG